METKDCFEIGYWIVSCLILMATVYVIYWSPIKAVKVGRELNEALIKETAKRNLFLALFARRGMPAHQNFVDALNQIDVVFYDNPKVLHSWHKYFESLENKNLTDEDKTRTLLRIDLLSSMLNLLDMGI